MISALYSLVMSIDIYFLLSSIARYYSATVRDLNSQSRIDPAAGSLNLFKFSPAAARDSEK